jgi:hypothetical protein
VDRREKKGKKMSVVMNHREKVTGGDSVQRAANNREQRGDRREQRAASREQRAEIREQRVDSREQTAESREQRADSRELTSSEVSWSSSICSTLMATSLPSRRSTALNTVPYDLSVE